MLLISTAQVPTGEQHRHAHLLLSKALKGFGIDYVPDVTPVIHGEHGKPSLAELPEVRYNISHADGIAAVVVSEFECGIDCERVREYRQSVVKRVCSEAEQVMINAAPDNERDLLFFRLWTLKEAYVKALGRGLSFPLREAEFAFDGDEILTGLSGCSFSQYLINGGSVAAVCELTDRHTPHKLYRLQITEESGVY